MEKKNVKIAPHHSEGERKRKIDEAYQLSLTVNDKSFLVDALRDFLKPQLIQIAERAFKRYCIAHGATEDMTETEWKRFKRFYERLL